MLFKNPSQMPFHVRKLVQYCQEYEHAKKVGDVEKEKLYWAKTRRRLIFMMRWLNESLRPRLEAKEFHPNDNGPKNLIKYIEDVGASHMYVLGEHPEWEELDVLFGAEERK